MFSYSGEKVIDQCGFTAAVNDGSRATSRRLFHKSKRGLKVRAVPTDCVCSFRCRSFPNEFVDSYASTPRLIDPLLIISQSQERWR